MTDGEIKKALECCIIGDCQGCIYGKTDQVRCRDNLMQNALNLINRQQAEIERLKKELNIISILYQDEQERYKELLDSKCDRCIARDKAEAIKELIFNLDEEISTYSSNGKSLNVYAWIKNYIKEMGLE